MDLRELQQPPHTLDILHFLAAEGPASVAAILDGLGIGPESFYNAARRLEDLQLVFRREERGFPSRVLYGLTVRGEGATGPVAALSELVEGSLGALRDRVVALEEEAGPEYLEAALSLCGSLYTCGAWDECLALLEPATRTAREGGARGAEALLLVLQGKILQQRGDPQETDAHLSRALDLAAMEDLPSAAAEASYHLASLAEDGGDYPGAEALFREAAEHAGRADDLVLVQRSRLALGRLLVRRGLYREARDMMAQVVEALETAGEAYELPRAYANLAATMYYVDPERELEWQEKCIEAARRACDVRIEAYALSNAAAAHINRGDFEVARGYLDRARGIFEDLEEEGMVGFVDGHFGSLHAAQGEWRTAEASFERALSTCRRLGQRYRVADILYQYGQMEANQGRDERARDLLEESVSLFEEVGNAEKARRSALLLESLTP